MESQSFFKKGYVQTLMTLALVGVVASLAAYAYTTFKTSESLAPGATTITVQGEGEVFAKPDIGMFSFSVMAEGKDASEAQTKSAESMNAILSALKASGVNEKDIKTSAYNLNPKYRYEAVACKSFEYCPPSNPVIDGFELSQTIEVKVRDLTKTGELISLAGSKGATNMSNLQFTFDDQKVFKAEARKLAIEDAKAKAAKLAEELGVRTVRMTSFWEDQGIMYPMMEKAYGGEMDAMSARNAMPEIPTGENTIKSTVSITYEIK